MRDVADNVVVVCSIENLDPMGVHTGDSITVAPALTLTDREYQRLRDIGIAVIREVGVDTGGCNIQFAVNPRNGRIIVIEMNPASLVPAHWHPRPPASRSPRSPRRSPSATPWTTSATTSPRRPGELRAQPRLHRCQGAALRLREVPPADPTLTTTMKSVGGAMALGRNFTEALQKALRSMEKADWTFHWTGQPPTGDDLDALLAGIAIPKPTPGCIAVQQVPARRDERRAGPRDHGDRPVVPRPDRLDQRGAAGCSRPRLDPDLLRLAKRHGFSDMKQMVPELRARRAGPCAATAGPPPLGVRPVTRRSTRAPPSSRRNDPITTRPMTRETEAEPREEDHHPGSAAPTGSGRVSSSTTPACTRVSPCARRRLAHHHGELQPPRPSRPTTTPVRGSASSR